MIFKEGYKMAAGSGRYNKGLKVPNAHSALDNMKYEIASELNLPVHQGSEDYWGNLSSKDCGRVGGSMVKKLIAMAEQQLDNK
jgi:small acid-soluble spore protein A (major alpha-type SASP)